MGKPWMAATLWIAACLTAGIVVSAIVNCEVSVEQGTKTPLEDTASMETLARAARMAGEMDADPLAVARIVLPEDLEGNQLVLAAASELAGAVKTRSGVEPATKFLPQMMTAADAPADIAAADNSNPDIVAVLDPSSPLDTQGYVLSCEGRSRWLVRASAPRGVAAGLFRIADAINSGWGTARLQSLFDSHEVGPEFPLRLVDLGGVGIVPDPDGWHSDDYSHNNLAFPGLTLSGPPYADSGALEAYLGQLTDYLTRMASYGYNGVVFEGFLQFIDFDKVGDGQDIYSASSTYRARHEKIRQAYTRLFQQAASLGFDIYLYTDMLTFSAPLKQYLQQRYGAVDPEDSRLWSVYRLGLEELFERFPLLDGLVVRVGEGGSVYNRPDWAYWSEPSVRSTSAVRTMLGEFGKAAGGYGRKVILRSWSVGLGEAGTMNTRPETYERVVQGLPSEGISVSTKFVQGDYESFLPFNPTLALDGPPRIMEFQCRREYEGFSAFPNYLGTGHQNALLAAISQRAAVEGVWVWTQTGGPVRAGPLSLYPFTGPVDAIDANAYATGRLAWDPQDDVAQITVDWVNRTYEPRDGPTAAILVDIVLRSHEAVKKSLYLSRFSERLITAGDRDAEAVGRLFQWDILSGSLSELGLAYHVLSREVDETIREGHSAVDEVRSMLAAASEIDLGRVASPARLIALRESLRYELSTFEVLAAYREFFLIHQRWLDEGDPADLIRLRGAEGSYQLARDRHVAAYGTNLAYPAVNFDAADHALALADRGTVTTWAARAWLLFTAMALVFLSRARPPARAATCLALLILGVMIFSSFLSPLLVLLIACVLGSIWLTAWLTSRRHAPTLWTTVATSELIAGGLILSLVALRGPSHLWQLILFDGAMRAVIITLTTVAALWGPFALYSGHRVSGRSQADALARVVMASAAGLAAGCAFTLLWGLESTVATINQQLGLLPYALAKTLGLTVYMNLTNRKVVLLATLATAVLIALLPLLRRRRSDA